MKRSSHVLKDSHGSPPSGPAAERENPSTPAGVERGGRAADLLDLVDVERLEQRLAVGEVAVQRADPDAGAARDLLQRRRLAALGEGLARGGEHLLVVAPGVGALRAGEKGRGGGLGGAHGDGLDKTEGPSAI